MTTLLFAGPAPSLRADVPPPRAAAARPAPVVLADSGLRKFFAGPGSRDRIVQVCVVAMCLALFIMMRKFSDGDGKGT